MDYDTNLESPLEGGHVIGKVELMLKEEVLLSRNIILKEEVEKKQIGDYLKEFIKGYCRYLFDNMEQVME